ncbi:unnamed protein product [Mytilus coruscus]|uniref:Uncharacterized protein n=1 Tax=Mytilus coruscus TaxID=42192 RepID=A0A6J8CJ87_MYTCO|nr:unnamed protein product [Mytilus coruscus]
MNEEPSTAYIIQLHIPTELQDEIDVIAKKHQGEAATSTDLDDNQKRWLVVGICLHSVISPALRKYVDSILTVLLNELTHKNKIDTQIYQTHLRTYPPNGAFLNYDAVNNNKPNFGKNNSKYDYTIKNAVDLSKIFLQTHMAHYTGFDETCDSSALLGLILNIAKFDPIVQSDADDVRRHIRNPWAHCNFAEWDAMKYSSSFQLMKKLVKDLKLILNKETIIIEEMEKCEINGQRFLSGTTHGLELVNELRQQTHVLAVYAKLVATEADDNCLRVKNELDKFEINILQKVVQLDKDMKTGFLEIDKKLEAQDKTLKNHNTQIVASAVFTLVLKLKFTFTVSDSYNVDIKF